MADLPIWLPTTGFGGTTTTSSSLFGTPTTGTSLFGSKPATGGGLFGAATTTSPFGQTQQTGTGLFGAKPATTFGTQPTSLFGGSSFNTATTTVSPFSFGSSPAAGSTLFGQPQSTFSSFGGFQQPATSTTSTGLFGAKPATSGFGGFGTTTTSATPFGTQQGGGLFGAKPATGGLFGTSTATTVFGSTQQAAIGSATPAAPIVLGANVTQSLIENAMIEAQLASSPYGDNPLLKLLPSKSQEKTNIPNPVRYVLNGCCYHSASSLFFAYKFIVCCRRSFSSHVKILTEHGKTSCFFLIFCK
ncbi:unnamed protein product [Gongylonema pulchrum]|uniref:Nucleoporin Nup98 n=1 Tax=Gongylonema pulchrum TaxID=637853 RepID=A0A183D075_9BILA|nr:unnamed protein product [Gongylonema pulchrum]